MHRCLELAGRGNGTVSPNPMVGCVIVHEGRIISEGWHKKAGEAHAEREAILQIAGDPRLAESTLYVNLEPCAHIGKTPPCADLILEHNIPCVVYGSHDPFSEVDGKGIQKLKVGNTKVIGPILKEECDERNRRFFVFHNQKRPYIILKWAESADGFMAPESGERTQISGEDARVLLHKWRSEEDAILVGSKTLLTDQPKLDVRFWKGENPLPVIFDSELKGNYQSFSNALVFNKITDDKKDGIEYVKCKNDNFILEALHVLFERNKLSVMVEGGAATLNQFISMNLWNEIRIIRSRDKLLQQGLAAPKIEGIMREKMRLKQDDVFIYRNK